MIKTKEHLRKWRTVWNIARNDSKRRGISFDLTFEQWLEIWESSGHLHERGRRRDQYQMARTGDVGPYAVGNVSIITCRENRAAQIMRAENQSRPGTQNGRAKLTEQQVIQLRFEYDGKRGSVARLARQYGISKYAANAIIKYKLWSHIL